MRRALMLKLAAGPRGVRHAGQELTVAKGAPWPALSPEEFEDLRAGGAVEEIPEIPGAELEEITAPTKEKATAPDPAAEKRRRGKPKKAS